MKLNPEIRAVQQEWGWGSYQRGVLSQMLESIHAMELEFET
jgi:hypothetical protein